MSEQLEQATTSASPTAILETMRQQMAALETALANQRQPEPEEPRFELTGDESAALQAAIGQVKRLKERLDLKETELERLEVRYNALLKSSGEHAPPQGKYQRRRR